MYKIISTAIEVLKRIKHDVIFPDLWNEYLNLKDKPCGFLEWYEQKTGESIRRHY